MNCLCSLVQESEQKRSDLEGNVKNLEKQLAGLSQRLAESSTDITVSGHV